MNPSDAMPIDEAQIHLLFEEAGLIHDEAAVTAPDMRRVDAVMKRAMHESVIKDTTSFVFKGFPAAIGGFLSVATGCVGQQDDNYRV